MQSGQFKIDPAGLLKAAPVILIVAAAAGLFYGILILWGVARFLGLIIPIFAGVWYVRAVRQLTYALPTQLDGLINGAIAGAAASLVNGLVGYIVTALILGRLGALAVARLGGFSLPGVILAVIFGAILGTVGAFGYMFLVTQKMIK